MRACPVSPVNGLTLNEWWGNVTDVDPQFSQRLANVCIYVKDRVIRCHMKESSLPAEITIWYWHIAGVSLLPAANDKTQQTQNIYIQFVQCWTNVEDVGPALYKWYRNVLCLLGTPRITAAQCLHSLPKSPRKNISLTRLKYNQHYTGWVKFTVNYTFLNY